MPNTPPKGMPSEPVAGAGAQSIKKRRKTRPVAATGVAARRTEYLYKEYARLSTVQQGYIKSSFDDFKMLSALGSAMGLVIATATFVAKASLGGEGSRNAEELARLTGEVSKLAFVAFLGMLALVAILAFRDLLKQSLIGGIGVHLTELEEALRGRMKLGGTRTFQVASTGHLWVRQQHRYVALVFHVVFYLALGGIPATVLILLGAVDLARVFGLVAGSLFIVHILAAGLLGRFTLETGKRSSPSSESEGPDTKNEAVRSTNSDVARQCRDPANERGSR
mgnify:CR=1 FL=1